MTWKSCLYEGTVRHRRHAPAENHFTYRMFMCYLDLEELPRLFQGRWLWSARRPALAWLKRTDHLGDPARPLLDEVRDLIERETGTRPAGPIRLLTHLRYFGYCFNPVSFYYCFDEADRKLETIVAEVNNTPWGDRHCYVLHDERNTAASSTRKRYRFRKDFHVSPFMDLDMDYDWRFSAPGGRLAVHMENLREGRAFFDATMQMKRVEITGPSLASALLRFPFMTGQVIALIYWQALKLWLKKCPYYPHPGNPPSPAPEARH